MEERILDMLTERLDPPTQQSIEQSRQQQMELIRNWRRILAQVQVKN